MIALYAYAKSNPLLLVYPTDSSGRLCGHGDMSSHKYLHFFDITKCLHSSLLPNCPTTQSCVETCPKDSWSWVTLFAEEKLDGINITKRRQQLICISEIDFNQTKWAEMPLDDLISTASCAPYTLPTTPVLKRCIPSFVIQAITGPLQINTTLADKDGNEVTVEDLLSSKGGYSHLLNAQSWIQGAMGDLQKSWRHIVVFVVIALVVSFLWILLLRLIVAPVVWTTIVIYFLLCTTAFCFCIYRYHLISQNIKPLDTIVALADGIETDINLNFDIYGETEDLWLIATIVTGVLVLASLLVICFVGSRIRLAIKLFEEASVALGYMPYILLWPIVPFITQAAVFALALGTAICLATLSRPEFANRRNAGLLKLPDTVTNCNYTWAVDAALKKTSEMTATLSNDLEFHSKNGSQYVVSQFNRTVTDFCSFVDYAGNNYTVFLQLYNLFIFIWSYHFLAGFGMVTLAGCYASYYWAFRKPQDIPMVPLVNSFWRALRYHLGSIAFGSLLIAIVQFIRIILDYIQYKMKEQRNYVAGFVLKCVSCCFRCLEKLVKFVTNKAYVMMAIHGKNFCISALDGWRLVMRNAVRAVILSGVSSVIIVLSKLIVTGAMSKPFFVSFPI